MPACSVQPASGVERRGGGNIPREAGYDCVSARPPWGFLCAAPSGAGNGGSGQSYLGFPRRPPTGAGNGGSGQSYLGFPRRPPAGAGNGGAYGMGTQLVPGGTFLAPEGAKQRKPQGGLAETKSETILPGVQPRKRVAQSTSGTINALRTLRMRGGAGSGRMGGCRRGRGRRG